MAASGDSFVLSTVEFEVLWAAARLPTRQVALDVPSRGDTHAERQELVEQACRSLDQRGLLCAGRVIGELIDLLNLFAEPSVLIDVWLLLPREVRGVAASRGGDAVLGLIDGDDVWLVPTTDARMPGAVIAAAGELSAGVGQSVSLPAEVFYAAIERSAGNAAAMVTALADRGLSLWQAQEVAGMLVGIAARGQFGVRRRGPDGAIQPVAPPIHFHDTDAGRYVLIQEPAPDGAEWCTLTPANNAGLADRLRQLLDLGRWTTS